MTDLGIVWTNHAISRVNKRFGFREDILIPNDKLKNIGRHTKIGNKFSYKKDGIDFRCLRKEDRVVVLTVMKVKDGI